MKTRLLFFFLLLSLTSWAQDAGDGTGRIDIHGFSPNSLIGSDSSVGLIKTIGGLRAQPVPSASKAIWLRDGTRFLLPSTGAEDSVFTLKDGAGTTFRSVLTAGQVPFEWFMQAFGNGNNATYAFQRAMKMMPSGFTLTFSDSAAYVIDSMIVRTKPIKIRVLNNKISFTQNTPYCSMFYFNSDSCNWDGGIFYQSGFGDEIDFPRGYGSAIIFQDVQSGCFVTNTKIYNCGDYLHGGTLSPRNATFGTTGKLTSSAGIYATRSGGVKVQDNYIAYSITGFNSDGYQNKNVGTPGHQVIGTNDIDHNVFEDDWQCVVFDGLDSAGLLDAFPGWIHRNTFKKTAAFTATSTGGTIGVKLFTNNSNNGTVVEDNYFSGRWSAAAVAQTGSYNTSFTNNRFDSCYDCVIVQNAGKVARNIDISFNKFNASAHSDMTLSGVYNSQIYNNRSLNGRGNGIVLTGYCVGIDMAHNNIVKMAGHAYQFETGYSFNVDGGYLIDVAGLSGILATDTAVISINPAGASGGVLYDVNIRNVAFDEQFTDGTNPTLVSKTAIRAHGQWANSNTVVGPGKWERNFLGRTRILDDAGERSYGARQRSNNYGGVYDTAVANINDTRYDESNFMRLSVSSTGSGTIKMNGTTPQLILPDSTTVQKILFATGGLRTNATIENGNLGSITSTGVGSSTDSRFTGFGQSSIIYGNVFNGTTGATMTGTAGGARSIFGSPTYTLNGSGNNVGNTLMKAPTLVSGTGTAAMGYTLALQGLSALGTRNTGLWLYNSGMTADGSFPYDQSTRVLGLRAVDSAVVQMDNLNNLPRQQVTAGTATTPARANILLTFNPASALASHTLTMPASPTDQQIVEVEAGGTITTGTVITSFSVAANSGQRLIQAATPTTLSAGEYLAWVYNSSLAAWFRRH
jgi:hypothetical protein